MKKSRKLVIGIAFCLAALMITGSALAGGIWYSYNLTLPRFGGSAITNNQTKLFNERTAVDSISVGGSYRVKVRQELQNNTVVSGTHTIDDNTLVIFATNARAGQIVHNRFMNYWSTPVNVVVYGRWSPDNPYGN